MHVCLLLSLGHIPSFRGQGKIITYEKNSTRINFCKHWEVLPLAIRSIIQPFLSKYLHHGYPILENPITHRAQKETSKKRHCPASQQQWATPTVSMQLAPLRLVRLRFDVSAHKELRFAISLPFSAADDNVTVTPLLLQATNMWMPTSLGLIKHFTVAALAGMSCVWNWQDLCLSTMVKFIPHKSAPCWWCAMSIIHLLSFDLREVGPWCSGNQEFCHIVMVLCSCIMAMLMWVQRSKGICLANAYSNWQLQKDPLPYQLYAAFWMLKRDWGDRMGGFVADEMGLGKTMKVILYCQLSKWIASNHEHVHNHPEAHLTVHPLTVTMQ